MKKERRSEEKKRKRIYVYVVPQEAEFQFKLEDVQNPMYPLYLTNGRL
jgi:hypothetical protein